MQQADKEYYLRHKPTGTYVTFRVKSHTCGETQFSLDTDQEYPVYIARTPEQAEFARTNNTKWYNAGYETPTNHLIPEDLEVVERIIAINPITVKLPTQLEILEWKVTKYSDYKIHIEWLKDICKMNNLDINEVYCNDYQDMQNYLKEKQ